MGYAGPGHQEEKRDGNSYVVSAPDGNTYIRGRRLLKPISSPNIVPEQPEDNSDEETEATGDNSASKKEMPRRSPRNHVSTRAADIEIAARITAIYIRDIDNGADVFNTSSGCGAQSTDRQPDYN